MYLWTTLLRTLNSCFELLSQLTLTDKNENSSAWVLHPYFIILFSFITLDEEEITVSLYLHQNDSVLNVKESNFVWQGKIKILQNVRNESLECLLTLQRVKHTRDLLVTFALDLRQSGYIVFGHEVYFCGNNFSFVLSKAVVRRRIVQSSSCNWWPYLQFCME